MNYMNLLGKQSIVPILLFFFLGIESVYAKKIDIKNETSLIFHTIIIDYERNENRNTHAYNSRSVFGASAAEFDVNKTETIPYSSKIDLKKGICKLTFVAEDSIILYAVNTEKTKKTRIKSG